MCAPSAMIATIVPKPGCPGSELYAGDESTFSTASAAMFPYVSLPLLLIAFEMITPIYAGKESGGKLLPPLLLQQLSSSVLPDAVGSHTVGGPISFSANPLNDGFALYAPPVT